MFTVWAADELRIFTTSVRYVTKFHATLNANLFIPAQTVKSQQTQENINLRSSSTDAYVIG